MELENPYTDLNGSISKAVAGEGIEPECFPFPTMKIILQDFHLSVKTLRLDLLVVCFVSPIVPQSSNKPSKRVNDQCYR